MAIEFDWDLIQGWSMRDGLDGVMELTRPVMVSGLTGLRNADGSQNPYVLIQARQAVIAEGYPKGIAFSPDFPLAFLEDFNVRTIDSNDSVIVELVYRKRLDDDSDHASGSIWSITDAPQASHVQTFATADGSQSLSLNYMAKKQGNGNFGDHFTEFNGAVNRIGGVHKVVVNRVITATGMLRGTDWNDWKKDVRAAAGKINADLWGTDPRGYWLFLGPQTKFFDRRRTTVQVQLTFIGDANLHFPMLAYFDERGLHPSDCTTEAGIRKMAAGGDDVPPNVNTIRQANGMTWASVQREAAFTPLFSFTPDQD